MAFVLVVSLVTKSSPMAQFSIDYEEIEDDDDDDDDNAGDGPDAEQNKKKKNHAQVKSTKYAIESLARCTRERRPMRVQL